MKVVIVCGGAGGTLIAKGVRSFASFITGVIAVTDNGRSTGVIRQKDGDLFEEKAEVQAPGDLRNYILSTAVKNVWLAELLQQRLKDGMALGNLLMGMWAKKNGGSMEGIAEKLCELFLPTNEAAYPISTSPDVHIKALLADGTRREGEVSVRALDKDRIIQLDLNHPAGLYHKAKKALEEADLIVYGPGSFLSSVTPSFLYTGFVDALLSNKKAPKVLILNTTTQRGQTDGWTPALHVEFLLKSAGAAVLDYVLVNNEEPPPESFARLKEEKREYLRVTPSQQEQIESYGVRVWAAPLIDKYGAVAEQWQKDDAIVYHAPDYVASELRKIVHVHRGLVQTSSTPVLNGGVRVEA